MTIVFKGGNYDHIKCNLCDTVNPPAKVLLNKGGLEACGWFVAGGIHRCPSHHDAACAPEAPIRLDE
jgi:hypothetical protein